MRRLDNISTNIPPRHATFVTLRKFDFLETVQLLLISCRCGCSVKGLQGSVMAAREREGVDRCAAPLRWGEGLVEGREVGEGVVYCSDPN
jgi:hypothetical protein